MNVLKMMKTLLYGLAGGCVFFVLHLPLPWILGPAFAIMLLNTFRPQAAEWPRWASEWGIITVAYLLGRTMTAEMAGNMLDDLPWMIMAGGLWIVVCLIVGLVFAKVARLDESSAVLGCMPGGLTQMVVLAGDMKNADPGIVALMQTARLIIVLYTVPFLAAVFAHPVTGMEITGKIAMEQNPLSDISVMASWPSLYGYLALPLVLISAWLTKRLRLPAGEFLGPVLLVSAFSIGGFVWPSVPAPLLAAAQLAIGIYIGKRVQPRILVMNKRIGPLALVTSILLVAITAAAAWGLSGMTEGSVVTWFLALAPGGIGEVAVTALLLKADVSQVTAYQMFRLFFILLVAPPVLRMVLKKKNGYKAKVLE